MPDVQEKPPADRPPLVSQALLLWMFRPLKLVSLITSVCAVAYVMMFSQLLKFDVLSITPLFILVHCVAVVGITGSTRSSAFGHLYVQGFDRATLWRHTMLASAISVLLTWLSAACVIWFGIRSQIQDSFNNYLFPLMRETEYSYPLWCLLAYAVLIPAFHYAWIRERQPTRGATNGMLLAFAVVATAFAIWNSVHVADLPALTIALITAGLALVAISLLIAGRILHQRLEVMS